MKKVILFLLVVVSFASCSPGIYSASDNGIIISGKTTNRHHVEIISVPRESKKSIAKK